MPYLKEYAQGPSSFLGGIFMNIWWPPNTLVNVSKCPTEHMEIAIAIAIAIVSVGPYTTTIMKHNQCAWGSLYTNRKLEKYKLILSKPTSYQDSIRIQVVLH
jgi:hypothetical protein